MNPTPTSNPPAPDLWSRHIMALDEVTERLERICRALNEAGVPYALVGGQAVAIWVASRDPAAVRTTKDVDLLLCRGDLTRASEAAATVELDFVETGGAGMFMERHHPSVRDAVHVIWAGEKVRPSYLLPAPAIEDRVELVEGRPVVTLDALVRMKLQAHRKHDQVHILDMIGVGLIGQDALTGLPPLLAERLQALFDEYKHDYEGDPFAS
jgi:hypothetical protein